MPMTATLSYQDIVDRAAATKESGSYLLPREDGWQVILLDDGVSVGGGFFPNDDDSYAEALELMERHAEGLALDDDPAQEETLPALVQPADIQCASQQHDLVESGTCERAVVVAGHAVTMADDTVTVDVDEFNMDEKFVVPLILNGEKIGRLYYDPPEVVAKNHTRPWTAFVGDKIGIESCFSVGDSPQASIQDAMDNGLEYLRKSVRAGVEIKKLLKKKSSILTVGRPRPCK
ncbi:MAG: hypothetical protein LUE17_05845 [Planctomycetaceae bacterium]|nr:hypothetical protein [Planctomycetaceae bacterium]